MLLREFFNDQIDEKQIWARSGKNVVRKYRCQGGLRNGRIVATAAQCFAAPNIKKRVAMKKLKARMGRRLTKKAQRTKRINPASRRVQMMNRPTGGRK